MIERIILEDEVIKTLCTEMIQKLSKKGINDFAFVKTADNKHKNSVLQIIRKPNDQIKLD